MGGVLLTDFDYIVEFTLGGMLWASIGSFDLFFAWLRKLPHPFGLANVTARLSRPIGFVEDGRTPASAPRWRVGLLGFSLLLDFPHDGSVNVVSVLLPVAFFELLFFSVLGPVAIEVVSHVKQPHLANKSTPPSEEEVILQFYLFLEEAFPSSSPPDRCMRAVAAAVPFFPVTTPDVFARSELLSTFGHLLSTPWLPRFHDRHAVLTMMVDHSAITLRAAVGAVVPSMGVRLMAVRAPAGTTVVPVFSAHAGEMEDSAFKGLGRGGDALPEPLPAFFRMRHCIFGWPDP